MGGFLGQHRPGSAPAWATGSGRSYGVSPRPGGRRKPFVITEGSGCWRVYLEEGNELFSSPPSGVWARRARSVGRRVLNNASRVCQYLLYISHSTPAPHSLGVTLYCSFRLEINSLINLILAGASFGHLSRQRGLARLPPWPVSSTDGPGHLGPRRGAPGMSALLWEAALRPAQGQHHCLSRFLSQGISSKSNKQTKTSPGN